MSAFKLFLLYFLQDLKVFHVKITRTTNLAGEERNLFQTEDLLGNSPTAPRRGTASVSTVLRKSVRSVIIDILLTIIKKICKASSEVNRTGQHLSE